MPKRIRKSATNKEINQEPQEKKVATFMTRRDAAKICVNLIVIITWFPNSKGRFVIFKTSFS